jgi:hypothetical protein
MITKSNPITPTFITIGKTFTKLNEKIKVAVMIKIPIGILNIGLLNGFNQFEFELSTFFFFGFSKSL